VAEKRDEDGSVSGFRVCIDPRPINKMIKSVSYPVPLIREIHEQLKGSVVFTQLDLKSGYNQCRVREEDQEKTTFTWNGVQYCFVGCPFGFKHVTSWFQRIMQTIFIDMHNTLKII
jgi:hypothetical protein